MPWSKHGVRRVRRMVIHPKMESFGYTNAYQGNDDHPAIWAIYPKV